MWDRKLYLFNRQTQRWEAVEDAEPLNLGLSESSSHNTPPLLLQLEAALDGISPRKEGGTTGGKAHSGRERESIGQSNLISSDITGLTGTTREQNRDEQAPRLMDEERERGAHWWSRTKSQRWFFALGGMLGGVIICLGFLVGIRGIRGMMGAISSPSPTVEQQLIVDQDLEQQVERYIRILESIASRTNGTPHATEADATLTQYEQCLRVCESDYSCKKGEEDCDKALLINCKKQCMARYHPHFKRIRDQYYHAE